MNDGNGPFRRVTAVSGANKDSRPLPKRRMPEGKLELPMGTKSSYGELKRTMHVFNYDKRKISVVRQAYTFAKEQHKGKTRRGRVAGEREDYIAHPINLAIRAIRLGLNLEDVCAALLHDTIEDTTSRQLTPQEIEGLFVGQSVRSGFGARVAETVICLTKPKFSKDKKWIFPTDPRYYQMKDEYTKALYDRRSAVYYDNLLNSGNFGAIALKLLDNIHNAETMIGIRPEQRQKNFRTMANNTIACASALFSKTDVEYLKGLFTKWGFELPDFADLSEPEDVVVLFPNRNSLNMDTLLTHPNLEFAFVTVYGSAQDAFIDDYVEIGLPPNIPINYPKMLSRYLPDFVCEQQLSKVPKTFASHEAIFRVHGFNPQPSSKHKVHSAVQLSFPGMEAPNKAKGSSPRVRKPNKRVTPSPNREGFVEILDHRGKAVIGLSRTVFSEMDVYFPNGAGRLFEKTSKRFGELISGLRLLYEESIRPELEISSSINPPPPEE